MKTNELIFKWVLFTIVGLVELRYISTRQSGKLSRRVKLDNYIICSEQYNTVFQAP